MGTVSGNTSLSYSTAFPNQKKQALTSNGVLWEVVARGSTWVLSYSQDGGTTWTDSALPFTVGGFNYLPQVDIFIDETDSLYIVYKSPSSGDIRLAFARPGDTARTAWVWAPTVQLDSFTGAAYATLTGFPVGSGWQAHVAMNYRGSSGTAQAVYYQVGIAADGTTMTVGSAVGFTPPYSQQNISPTFPTITHKHTGDGKTKAASNPDLIVAWSAGPNADGFPVGIHARRGTWDGAKYVFATSVQLSSQWVEFDSQLSWMTCQWDGSRVVMFGYLWDGASRYFQHRQTDGTLANLAGSELTVPASTAIGRGGGTFDGNGSWYLFGGTTSVGYYKWTRSSSTAGALGSRVVLDASGQSNAFTAVRPAAIGALDWTYTDGEGPCDVVSGRLLLNTAPAAATPTTPATGSSVDRTQPITLAWVFSDPDAGDFQSKSDIRYKLTSASTWTTILGATTIATSYALPANQAAGNYEWQVLPYDALGVPAGGTGTPAWSSSSFFTAADPPGTPVITAPANGGTVATASYTVRWSSPQQDAYEVRRVADNAGSPNPGTVYVTTGTVEDSTSRARTLAFETNNRAEHVQVRVRYSGIWSQWATARVLVSYAPPATPVVVLTVQDATASILVSITNPTPSGSQPTVASHDILIDDGFGEGFTRRVTGWSPGAAFTYWLPVSGRDYAGNVQVVAVATNSTTSTGTAT